MRIMYLIQTVSSGPSRPWSSYTDVCRSSSKNDEDNSMIQSYRGEEPFKTAATTYDFPDHHPTKKDKKWSFGNLFRRKRKDDSGGESSSDEDKKSFLSKSKHRKKKDRKTLGGFDHIVIGTKNALSTRQQDDGVLSDPSGGFSGFVGRPLPRIPLHNEDRVSSVGSAESVRKGSRRRVRTKARAEARRDSLQRGESSSDGDSHSSSKFRSDDSLSRQRDGSLSRRSRTARTERYIRRITKDEESILNREALQRQTRENWKFSEKRLHLENPDARLFTVPPSHMHHKYRVTHVPLKDETATFSNCFNIRSLSCEGNMHKSSSPEVPRGRFRNLSLVEQPKFRQPPAPPPRDPKRFIQYENLRPTSYCADKHRNWNVGYRTASEDHISTEPKQPLAPRPASVTHENRSKYLESTEKYQYLTEKKPRSRRPIFIQSNDKINTNSYNEANPQLLKNHTQLRTKVFLPSVVKSLGDDVRGNSPFKPISSQSESMDSLHSENKQETNRRKSSNLEDALDELEAIYKSLHLGDEDLLERAEQRELSIATRKMIDSKTEAYPDFIMPRGSISDSSFTYEPFDTTDSPKRKRFMKKSHTLDRKTDDMAFRKLNKDRSNTICSTNAANNISYLLASPVHGPQDEIDFKENDNEPDITLDDVVYRSIKHSKNSLKTVQPQPPFGIPVGPITPAPDSDYLHAVPESPIFKHKFKKEPDVVKDDLAFRNLRKDNTKEPVLDDFEKQRKKRAVRSLSANICNLMLQEEESNKTSDIHDVADAMEIARQILREKEEKIAATRRAFMSDSETKYKKYILPSASSTETITESRLNFLNQMRNDDRNAIYLTDEFLQAKPPRGSTPDRRKETTPEATRRNSPRLNLGEDTSVRKTNYISSLSVDEKDVSRKTLPNTYKRYTSTEELHFDPILSSASQNKQASKDPTEDCVMFANSIGDNKQSMNEVQTHVDRNSYKRFDTIGDKVTQKLDDKKSALIRIPNAENSLDDDSLSVSKRPINTPSPRLGQTFVSTCSRSNNRAEKVRCSDKSPNFIESPNESELQSYIETVTNICLKNVVNKPIDISQKQNNNCDENSKHFGGIDLKLNDKSKEENSSVKPILQKSKIPRYEAARRKFVSLENCLGCTNEKSPESVKTPNSPQFEKARRNFETGNFTDANSKLQKSENIEIFSSTSGCQNNSGSKSKLVEEQKDKSSVPIKSSELTDRMYNSPKCEGVSKASITNKETKPTSASTVPASMRKSSRRNVSNPEGFIRNPSPHSQRSSFEDLLTALALETKETSDRINRELRELDCARLKTSDDYHEKVSPNTEIIEKLASEVKSIRSNFDAELKDLENVQVKKSSPMLLLNFGASAVVINSNSPDVKCKDERYDFSISNNNVPIREELDSSLDRFVDSLRKFEDASKSMESKKEEIFENALDDESPADTGNNETPNTDFDKNKLDLEKSPNKDFQERYIDNPLGEICDSYKHPLKNLFGIIDGDEIANITHPAIDDDVKRKEILTDSEDNLDTIKRLQEISSVSEHAKLCEKLFECVVESTELIASTGTESTPIEEIEEIDVLIPESVANIITTRSADDEPIPLEIHSEPDYELLDSEKEGKSPFEERRAELVAGFQQLNDDSLKIGEAALPVTTYTSSCDLFVTNACEERLLEHLRSPELVNSAMKQQMHPDHAVDDTDSSLAVSTDSGLGCRISVDFYDECISDSSPASDISSLANSRVVNRFSDFHSDSGQTHPVSFSDKIELNDTAQECSYILNDSYQKDNEVFGVICDRYNSETSGLSNTDASGDVSYFSQKIDTLVSKTTCDIISDDPQESNNYEINIAENDTVSVQSTHFSRVGVSEDTRASNELIDRSNLLDNSAASGNDNSDDSNNNLIEGRNYHLNDRSILSSNHEENAIKILKHRKRSKPQENKIMPSKSTSVSDQGDNARASTSNSETRMSQNLDPLMLAFACSYGVACSYHLVSVDLISVLVLLFVVFTIVVALILRWVE